MTESVKYYSLLLQSSFLIPSNERIKENVKEKRKSNFKKQVIAE